MVFLRFSGCNLKCPFCDTDHSGFREMSADELEDACHKSLKVNVSSTAALARILDKMSLEYKILSDNDANIYGRPGISELVMALDKEGCKLNSCSEQEETLEGFFISLVGGGSNE